MGDVLGAHRGQVTLLTLVTLLSPNTIESTSSGPLDAMLFRRSIANLFWSLETEGVQTMIETSGTFWFQFPNLSASPFTIIAWIVGFPCLVIAVLSLDGRIGGLAAILALALISVFVLGALGITVLTMGYSFSVF
ncbi:MAG: hypothetical protein ACXAEB_14615, partial [Candidatus Thorarchaeota archaeon]